MSGDTGVPVPTGKDHLFTGRNAHWSPTSRRQVQVQSETYINEPCVSTVNASRILNSDIGTADLIEDDLTETGIVTTTGSFVPLI